MYLVLAVLGFGAPVGTPTPHRIRVRVGKRMVRAGKRMVRSHRRHPHRDSL